MPSRTFWNTIGTRSPVRIVSVPLAGLDTTAPSLKTTATTVSIRASMVGSAPHPRRAIRPRAPTFVTAAKQRTQTESAMSASTASILPLSSVIVACPETFVSMVDDGTYPLCTFVCVYVCARARCRSQTRSIAGVSHTFGRVFAFHHAHMFVVFIRIMSASLSLSLSLSLFLCVSTDQQSIPSVP